MKLSKKKKPSGFTYKIRTPRLIERTEESYYYDLIVSSGEIKKLILKRIEDLGVDLGLVLQESGIKIANFKENYLRSKDPVSMPSIRQSHMIALLDNLGVKVKIVCVVKDKENVMVEHLKKEKKIILKNSKNDE